MSWFHDMADKIKENIEELKVTVKDWITHQYDTKITVQECAYRIISHPSTQHKKAEYLGLLFHQYTLREQGMIYRLETKGPNNEQILELKILEDSLPIYAYHYYQEDSRLTQTIHLPKEESLV